MLLNFQLKFSTKFANFTPDRTSETDLELEPARRASRAAQPVGQRSDTECGRRCAWFSVANSTIVLARQTVQIAHMALLIWSSLRSRQVQIQVAHCVLNMVIQ